MQEIIRDNLYSLLFLLCILVLPSSRTLLIARSPSDRNFRRLERRSMNDEIKARLESYSLRRMFGTYRLYATIFRSVNRI